MKNFQTTEYHIKSHKIRSGSEIRIVLLADLHNKVYGEDNDTLLRAIDEARPDLILIAGDMLIGRLGERIEVPRRLIGQLVRRYPVYYGPGNHEQRLRERVDSGAVVYETYRTGLQRQGVCFLEDTHRNLQIKGTPIRIYGYEFPWAYYQKLGQPAFTADKLEAVLGAPAADLYTILLVHNPVYFSAYAKWGADLSLSGHLHGGIVRLPLLGGVISPQFKLFPRYDRGLFQQDEKKLVVSAGLGEHTLKMRINNRPELVLLHLTGSEVR